MVAALRHGPHAVLGVQTQASAEEVRAAFRRAALRTHPDKAGGSNEAFAAVQRAYDLLAGYLGPDLSLSTPPSQQVQQSTEFHTSNPSQPSDGCGVNATGQHAQRWESEAFDPWSSASLESFDPWSTASFTGTTYPSTAPTVEKAETQSTGAANGQDPSKKRKRPNKASIRPMARPRWKKGAEPFSLDEATLQLMRNGVYGYRADGDTSSEDASDEPVAAVAGALSPSPAFVASARAWSDVADRQAASARSSSQSLALPLAPSSTTVRNTRPATAQPLPTWATKPAGTGQYYCSLHKRLRFESALVDDGEGNPVCKPGMECP